MQLSPSTTFDSRTYIQTYYSSPEGHKEENLENKFHVWMREAFEMIPSCETGIEIGCGPVLNLAFFGSRKIKKLILTEFNTECFKWISAWVKGQPINQVEVNWQWVAELVGQMEGSQPGAVSQRLKDSLECCLKIDLTTQSVFEYPFWKKVDIITSSLCIEAVATTASSYKQILKNLKNYLNPQGYLFLIGVLEETFYMVGEQRLPCFAVTKDLLVEAMKELGFTIVKLNTFYPDMPPTETSDFKGLFSLLARADE